MEAGTDTPEERDWSPWHDGRPHWLKRGRDYVGDPKAVIRRARGAAAAIDKLAVSSLDSSGKYEWLWIQFVDGEVEQGKPCPVCDGVEMAKVQKHFLRCLNCGATLKAANDWEVEAGEYMPPPAEDELETAAEQEEPAEEEAHRAAEMAELLGAQLFSAQGEETLEPLVSEEFFIEFSIRFLEPVEWAVPRVRLSIGPDMSVLRVQPPRALRVPEPRTLQARVRIPAYLLMPKSYTVELVVLMFPDLTNLSHYERLIDPEALTFKVSKPPRGDLRALDPFSELGSPFDWELAERPNEEELAERPDEEDGLAERPDQAEEPNRAT